MQRRSFFGALATVLLAPKALLAKPAPEIVGTDPRVFTGLQVGKQGRRTGLPTMQWRAINTSDEMIKMLKQTNEILMEMPWRE